MNSFDLTVHTGFLSLNIFITTSRVHNCSALSQICSSSLEWACRTTNFVLSCSGIESRSLIEIHWWPFPKIEGSVLFQEMRAQTLGPHFWETDWQRTAIRGGCKREGICEASFSKKWGHRVWALISWKRTLPPKNGQFRGQKKTGALTKFFSQLPNIYKIYILQNIWSKSANPALCSGPNISLPLIWGSHHQLDDQYKEPMVNTKII